MNWRDPIRFTGPARFIIMCLTGCLIGVMISGCYNPLPLRSRTEVVPAPYRVAKIPGGTALRLAMVPLPKLLAPLMANTSLMPKLPS